ncbi:MAG: addiction module protein [Saprospiraceae bacterium]|nr:addiction module protein [Saprospiraceae bacterium]
MGAQAAEIKDIFLQLPRKEQVELMQFFLDVIAHVPSLDESPFELSEAWKQELDKREADILNGTVQAIPLEKALQNLK